MWENDTEVRGRAVLTTTAARFAATIVGLDRRGEAAAFRADPGAARRGLPEPVLLDEWQAVPVVLGAVKRAVDADPRPGRFLLTGSGRAGLDTAAGPGTGRVVRLAMYPMTVAELVGRADVVPLIDRLAAGDELAPSDDPPDLRGYAELAVQGGFPEAALASSERARRHWVARYIDQLLTHDVEQLDEDRDPARLRRTSRPTPSTPRGSRRTRRSTTPPASTARPRWPTSGSSPT